MPDGTAEGMPATTRNGFGAVRWYVLAVVVILLDQYTKGLASESLPYAQPQRILSWFDLTLHHNTGAAFSFLHDAGGWQRYFFSIVAGAISVVLVVWLYLLDASQRLLALSLALILGGAIGNLWDRLVLGYVIDFISVHYEQRYFPAFNIADSAISVGAVLMLLDSFLHRDSDTSAESSRA